MDLGPSVCGKWAAGAFACLPELRDIRPIVVTWSSHACAEELLQHADPERDSYEPYANGRRDCDPKDQLRVDVAWDHNVEPIDVYEGERKNRRPSNDPRQPSHPSMAAV